jgi:hypothetical protein
MNLFKVGYDETGRKKGMLPVIGDRFLIVHLKRVGEEKQRLFSGSYGFAFVANRSVDATCSPDMINMVECRI